jgi:hypothetical protein
MSGSSSSTIAVSEATLSAEPGPPAAAAESASQPSLLAACLPPPVLTPPPPAAAAPLAALPPPPPPPLPFLPFLPPAPMLQSSSLSAASTCWKHQAVQELPGVVAAQLVTACCWGKHSPLQQSRATVVNKAVAIWPFAFAAASKAAAGAAERSHLGGSS